MIFYVNFSTNLHPILFWNNFSSTVLWLLWLKLRVAHALTCLHNLGHWQIFGVTALFHANSCGSRMKIGCLNHALQRHRTSNSLAVILSNIVVRRVLLLTISVLSLVHLVGLGLPSCILLVLELVLHMMKIGKVCVQISV